MSQQQASWISKLVSGAQLDAQAAELAAKTAQLTAQAEKIAELERELAKKKSQAAGTNELGEIEVESYHVEQPE